MVARRRNGAASGASTLAAGTGSATDSLAAVAAEIPVSEAETSAFFEAVLPVAFAAVFVLVAGFSTGSAPATASVAVFPAALVAVSLATTGEAFSAALDALLLAGFFAAVLVDGAGDVGGASASVASGGAAVFLAAMRRAAGGVVSVIVISSRPAAASWEVPALSSHPSHHAIAAGRHST